MEFVGDIFKKLSVAMGVNGTLAVFIISLSIWLYYDMFLEATLSGSATKGLICISFLVVLSLRLLYLWIMKLMAPNHDD